tara:strand:- start:20 stop:958 length:939 start_codon:yes stop_codon:yes gene_type:complete
MNIVFLLKPLSTIIPGKDTSLLFMQACQQFGCNLFFLEQNGASITSEGVKFRVNRFRCLDKGGSHSLFEIIETCLIHESNVDGLFIRTDPPFDARYLNDMWVLEQVTAPIKFINHPRGIKEVNEKIWVTQFKQCIPPTCITKNVEDLNDFLNVHESIILKPTDGFGGQSIVQLTKGDLNKNALFELLTDNFTRYTVAQKYIPESKNGDKRILISDGNAIGAILRIHSSNDHRNNFFAGGTAHKADITANDLSIINYIHPYLKKLGLRFVGIDIIGDFLIEINVTSPTCLQELNRLNQVEYHIDLVQQWLELS